MEDLSDNEREEQIRNWWAENWLWIIGGIALGLAALAGYQYWQKTKFMASEQDEASYMALLDSLNSKDRDAAAKHADALRKLHPKSPYADQADLALARAAVEARDLDTAAKRLRAVADSSRDAQLRLVARSRLARVLAEQGKHDDALALLNVADAGAFAALFHEIRGDIFAAKGDPASAAREYDALLAANGTVETGVDRAYVELKRDALAVAEAKAVPAPSAKPTTSATPTPAPNTAPVAPQS